MIEQVRLVNAAEDLRAAAVARCEAVDWSDRPCRNDGRWGFTLDDGRRVRVCRLHANAGERAGALRIARSP